MRFEMLRNSPLHPFLIGLFPILFLYIGNIAQLQWTEILLPLAITWGITVMLLAVAYAPLKKISAASILVSFSIVWFFSYGHFYNLFIGLTFNNVVVGRERWLMPIWVVFFILACVYLLRFGVRKSGVTKALNLISICAISLLLIKGYVEWKSSPKIVENSHLVVNGKEAGNSLAQHHDYKTGKSLPSIYYIILDSYSANSVLNATYNYDNSHFYAYLKKKGFYVAEKSCSNYPVTGLSLPSSLNMDYLDRVFDLRNKAITSIGDLKWSVESSAIAKYLSGKGYRLVKLGSWCAQTATDKEAMGYKSYILTEYNLELLRTTFLRPIAEQIFSPLLRYAVNDAFDQMAVLSKEGGPNFVFAHIICPHPPFVFGENGEEIGLSESMFMRLNPKSLYVSQVKYINKRVEKLIGVLTRESKVPPVIIIQADHGSGYVLHPTHNKLAPSRELLVEQFRVLNAYYLPNVGARYLSNDISPVNSLRVVLNTCFGERLNLLPNKSYYSNYSNPFDFVEVTDKVRY